MRSICLDTRACHNRVAKASKGYTLIEVIVSVAIFSAMVTLGTMALDQGLKQYHRVIDKGINFWENAKYIWVGKSFGSMVDYYISARSTGWFPYFQGNNERISYVSSSPLAGDSPVVVWIRNERQDDGSRSLVYYELPVYAEKKEALDRHYIFGDFKKGNTVTLLQGVADVEFSFYGYDLPDKKWKWDSVFDGSKRRLLPQAVKISYRDRETQEKKTVVFGIHTNSMNKMRYNGMYSYE